MNKNKVYTVVLVSVILLGIVLLLYPSVSNYVNSLHQSRAITDYDRQVELLDAEQYGQMLRDALEYNRILSKKGGPNILTDEEQSLYQSLLNIPEDGVMGYIEIPKIDCTLPIYHGTEETVLQIGVGHMEGSSLPVRSESSHCVLSGHRGLPSSRLFTDVDDLVVGDVFQIHVLDEVLSYEIDQILVVEPDAMDALKVVEGKEYCTLLTCTPYGINSHRLLVRGQRIEDPIEEDTIEEGIVSETIEAKTPLIWDWIVLTMILACLLFTVFSIRNYRKKRRSKTKIKKREGKKDEKN